MHCCAPLPLIWTGRPCANRCTRKGWAPHLDLLTRDGHAVPCRVDMREVSESGADHIVLVARDLSDLMAHTEQNHLQIQALNALDHAVLITDRQASVVWVNAAFTRLTGYELAEAVFHNPAELLKSGRT